MKSNTITLRYILLDVVAAMMAWALLFLFRKIGIEHHGMVDANQVFDDRNFWLGIVLVPLSLWLPLDTTMKILLNVIWLLLLVTELLNSAIEAIVDLVTPEWHPLAKQAKDMACAAVLCALIAFLASWIYALIHL